MAAEDSPITEDRSAQAAFETLAHETRVEIINALGDAESGLSFSALREAVGERDSGQFNYHLDKLRETFIEQNEDGAYELSDAGAQVYGAVLAGRYTKSATVEDLDIDGSCPFCDGELTGAYRGTEFTVTCDACGEAMTQSAIPPGVFEPYDVEEYPRVAWQYLTTRQMIADAGFCQLCSGPVERTVEPVEHSLDIELVTVRWRCQRCGGYFLSTLPAGIAHHEVIRSFARDHGRDVDEPIWEAGWLLMGESWVEADDPLRIAIEVELEDEVLCMTLDGELSVIDHHRDPG